MRAFLEIWRETVESHSNQPAFIDQYASYTFGEFDKITDGIVESLRAFGIGEGDFAGLCFDKCADYVAGLIAGLKLGCITTILSPSYPQERMNSIAQNCGMKCVLTNGRLHETVLKNMPDGLALLDVDMSRKDSPSGPWTTLSEEAPACAFYTSGSTGRPKGVLIPRRALIALSAYMEEFGDLGHGDRQLVVAPWTFVVSLCTVLPVVCLGKTLYIPDAETASNPALLYTYSLRHHITHAVMPTRLAIAMLNEFGSAEYQCISIGGEPFAGLKNRNLHVRLLNGYGMTETCAGITGFQFFADEAPERVPIGKPAAHVRVFIMDDDMNLVQPGQVGELCVAGPLVSLGYIGLPDETARAFVPNLFAEGVADGVLFKTGDLGYADADGNIHYMGRKDNMIKLRGQRIEPEEIERICVQYPGVKTVAVALRTVAGDNHLCAFYTAASDIDAAAIKQFFRQYVEGYMVPSYFVRLEAMPTGETGKLNRRALPEVVVTSDGNAMPPETPSEMIVAEAFAEALNMARIGVEENFFELGGHSLRAASVANRIQSRTGVRISAKDVFLQPTARALAAFIDQKRSEPFLSIPKAEPGAPCPMAPAQQNLYTIEQTGDCLTAYDVPLLLEIHGEIDENRLLSGFRAMIERHESLRTALVMEDGQPLQRVAERVDFDLPRISLGEGETIEDIFRRFVRKFDLSVPPLMRAALVEGRDGKWLLLDFHHAVFDGGSVRPFFEELAALYDGMALPPLGVQFADYSVWLKDRDLTTEKDYWAGELSGEIPRLDIAPDFARPVRQSFRGGRILGRIGLQTSERIRSLCRETETTEYMVLLTSFMALIGRFARQEDVVVGTPISVRTHSDVERMVGMLVNTLALRAQPKDEKSFLDFLYEVRGKCLGAYENAGCPFDGLVEAAGAARDLSRNPLFDVMFVLQEKEYASFGLGGATLKVAEHPVDTCQFDLTLEILPDEDGYALHLDYCADLYKEESVAHLLGHWLTLLESALESPKSELGELNLFTLGEREMLGAFNATAAAYDQEKTIHALFEEAAARAPEAVAVIASDATLTYEDLNARANGVARRLMEAGVKPNDLVAVVLPRTSSLVAAIFGILKSGAGYLPVDPEYPQERLRYMLADSGAKAVITARGQALAGYAGAVLYAEDLAGERGGNPDVRMTGEDLCYCIYTSGTTGKPKGALIAHRNVNNLVSGWAANPMQRAVMEQGDTVLAIGNVVFDISVDELIFPLVHGKCVALATERECVSPEEIGKLMVRTGANVMHVTPSRLESYLQDAGFARAFEQIRVVNIAGEASSAALRRRILGGGARVFNGYGPTETTVGVTYDEITDAEDITIGRPVANAQVYILDERMRVMPLGAAGELCVAGDGVGQGYLNRPELTAEKYVGNPFGEGRLYKTGDLARWCADGRIEYLGRKDGQIKLHGQRLELGEIEAAMVEVLGVRQAAVMLASIEGGQYLCAYYTGEAEEEAVRGSLAGRLPRHMVPAHIRRLEALPLNQSGKLDRRALPLPDFRTLRTSEYIAPETELEKALCEAFEQVLQAERVGVNDDFFSLGGDSLKAIRVVSRLQTRGLEISVKEIFESPTIAAMAKTARKACAAREASNFTGDIPATAAQTRIYMAQSSLGGTSYNVPMVLQTERPIEPERLCRAVKKLIARHESLRTRFTLKDGNLIQIIENEAGFSLDKTPKASFVRPFDLAKAPLIRVGADGCEIYLDIHHIVCDGGTMPLLLRELDALLTGKTLPEATQYREFAWDELKYRISGEYASDGAYWQDMFAEDERDKGLMPDHPNGARTGAAYVKSRLDPELTRSILKESGKLKVTPYAYLMSAVLLLLSGYGGERVSVGTVASGRGAEYENTAGMFANTLAIQTKIEGNQTVHAHIRAVALQLNEALKRQRYPYEALVKATGGEVGSQRNPLFDMLFVYQRESEPAMLDGQKLCMSGFEQGLSDAKFDISFEAAHEDGGFALHVEYRPGLYEEASIKRLVEGYRHILRQMTRDGGAVLCQLETLPPEEFNLVTCAFNATAAAYDQEKTVYALFEEAAARAPEAVAVTASDATLTYEDLNARANGVARRLMEAGVKPNDLVAVVLPRTSSLIAAIFGILKSGAGYMPVDPEYPQERLRYMLADSGAKAVITARGQALAGYAGAVFYTEELAGERGGNPDVWMTGEDLCYCIYTSGTTGKPKGALIAHRNVNNLVSGWAANPMQRAVMEQGDTVLAIGNVVFDISVDELIFPLVHGKCVALATERECASPEELGKLMVRTGANVMHVTPSRLESYLQDAGFARAFEQIRVVNIAGEASSAALRRRILGGGARVFNGYGPTETTVGVTYDEITDAEDITIGRPVANAQVYILDERMRVMPLGAAGELCVAGDGVGLGYLNRPELTAEKYVANPFGEGRLYKTGDLARWRADGRIEYLGRKDGQIKLHGQRLELGEIEAAMVEVLGVRQAAVMLASIEGGQYLCAYYTGDAEEEAVRGALAGRLPRHMVPAHIRRLEALPLNQSGKLDRRALPLPDFRTLRTSEYIAPETELEKALCEAFEQVLKAERVGVNDDFFSLGGDSLKAIQLVGVLSERGIAVTTKDVINLATPGKIARVSGAQGEAVAGEQGVLTGEAPLHPVQKWFLLREMSEPNHFNQSVVFEAVEPLDPERVRNALQAIMQRHDALRLRVANGEQEYTEEAGFDFWHTESSGAEEAILACERSHDLCSGKLLGAVLYDGGKKLFVSIHHWAVDGVSWGIFARDFAAYYSGSPARAKTASVRQWNEALGVLAQKLGDATVDRWRAVERMASEHPLPLKENAAPSSMGCLQGTNITVPAEKSVRLLRSGMAQGGANAAEVLLGVVACAFRDATKSAYLSLEVEGHGREDSFDNLDVTGTMGWFTSIYPAIVVTDADLIRQILKVKRSLRDVPDKGLSYGVLKYLSDRLPGDMPAGMTFNYLGEVGEAGGNSLLRVAPGEWGEPISSRNAPASAVSVTVIVSAGTLNLSFAYDPGMMDGETAQKWMDQIKARLDGAGDFEDILKSLQTTEYEAQEPGIGNLAQGGAEAANTLATADLKFGWPDISDSDLSAIRSRISEGDIEAVYPMTPVQAGMAQIGHLSAEAYYHEQSMTVMEREIDPDDLRARLAEIMKRFEILRTALLLEGLDSPYCVVMRSAAADYAHVNLSALPEDALARYFSGLLTADRIQRFDFGKAPLLRVKTFALKEGKTALLLSFPHALLDGWSVSNILEELFNPKPGRLMPPSNMVYARWFASRDKREAENYWGGLLEGVEAETVLEAARGEGYAPGEARFALDGKATRALEAFARRNAVTLSTCVQYAWASVLMRMCATGDVVFGRTTSGRPGEISRVSEMAGMFIATLPVRVRKRADPIQELKALQAQNMESDRFGYLPLSAIARAAHAKHRLFNHFIAYQNTPRAQSEINGRVFGGYNRSVYDLTLFISVPEEMELLFSYNQQRLSPETIQCAGELLLQELRDLSGRG